MVAGADLSGPTVRRLVLGAQLRRLREKSGIGRAQAGRAIRRSETTISRLELGRLRFKVSDVDTLLRLYGLPDGPARDELLEMAKYANEPGWWQPYSDVLPLWFQTYVGLETGASQIRTFETQLVPGLLQTEAYARAITSVGRTRRTPQEVRRRVESRRARQRFLSRPGTLFWAILEEGALRRPVGGPRVLHEQLTHLLTLTQRPRNVTIQVLPFSRGGHSRVVGAFSYLRFQEPDVPDVVYLEHLTGALYLEKPEEVEQYKEIFEHLSTTARPPDDSAEIIARIMTEL